MIWRIDIADQQQVSDVSPHQPEGEQSSVGGDNVSELEQLMKESQSKITGFSFTGRPASPRLFAFPARSKKKPAAKSTFGNTAPVFGQAEQRQKQQPAATFCEFYCIAYIQICITFNNTFCVSRRRHKIKGIRTISGQSNSGQSNSPAISGLLKSGQSKPG